MKNSKNIEFDDVIGGSTSTELTKKEHDSIRAYRRELYEKRSSEEKLNDRLAGFQFSLKKTV
jgi:hypothetical protein